MSEKQVEEDADYVELATTEVVDLPTGKVTQGEDLPLPAYDGCVVEHDRYLYWVVGMSDDSETNQVYRAKGEWR